MKHPILFSLVLALLLTACGEENPVPLSVTATKVATLLPTNLPTKTAVPTDTPTPTLESSPTVPPIIRINAENASQLVALHTIEDQEGANHAMFSSEGNLLIAVVDGFGEDSEPILNYWDIKSLSPLLSVEIDASAFLSTIAFHPTDDLIVTAVFSEKSRECVLSAFQSNTGKWVFEIQYRNQGLDYFIEDLEWSPDGRLIATGISDGQIQAYRADDLNRVFDIKIQPEEVNTVAQIHAVAFSPDSQLLAAAGQDEIVRIWDTSNWSEYRVFEKSAAPIYDIAFSPDGKFLAAAESGGPRASDPGQLSVWNVETGKKLPEFSPQYKEFAVAYSPDGTLLAAAGQDGHIRIWRTDTYELVADLTGHKSRVISLDFSPDGQFLASGSMSTFNKFEKDPEKQGYKEKVILWGLP